jgi:transposase-like protein
MAGRKIRNAGEARESLAGAARSGLTRAEWARRHGVDGRSLNAWRINLERGSKPAMAPSPVRLVELVVPSLAPSPARYVVRCGELEVEVDARFDETTLERLLRVVMAC